jgi:hypothetical protein
MMTTSSFEASAFYQQAAQTGCVGHGIDDVHARQAQRPGEVFEDYLAGRLVSSVRPVPGCSWRPVMAVVRCRESPARGRWPAGC